MNRFTIFALCALAAATANASEPLMAVDVKAKAQTRAEEQSSGYTIQYCGDLVSCYQLPTTYSIFMGYIHMDAKMATKLAGNKITDITFAVVTAETEATELQATLFVSEDLSQKPVCTKDFSFTPHLDGVDDGVNPIVTNTFDEPYVIKEGQEFWFGYKLDGCTKNLCPFGADNLSANEHAGYAVAFDGSGTCVAAYDLISALEHNIYLIAQTEGDVTAVDNFAEVVSLVPANYTLPVYKTGATPGKLTYTVANYGDNDITSIEYALVHNGEEGERVTQNLSLKKNKKTSKSLTCPDLVEGYNTFGFHIYKVNDVEWESMATASAIMIPEEDFVPRNFVVEKATGTWCGYCPAGIVGFEKMEESYPDTFIGIDLHTNDKFESKNPEVVDFMGIFDGVPQAIINRDTKYLVYPDASTLTARYNKWLTGCPGAASVSAEGSISEGRDGFDIEATSVFKYDDPNADYSLSFVLLENGLTGIQTNYYANQSGAPGDWGSKGSKVSWTYTHTAIDYTDMYGVPGSVPASVTKDAEYKFTQHIDTKYVKNIENAYINVLLLDNRTGVVLNAVTLPSYYLAGVNKVEADDYNAPAEYFNLQGMRVVNPEQGQVVIKRQGSKVTKMVVR